MLNWHRLNPAMPGGSRRSRLFLLVAAVLAGVVPTVAPMTAGAVANYTDCSATSPAGTAPCAFQGFEMDGNAAVDTTSGVDWATTPFPYTRSEFLDGSGNNSDNGFVQGSDYLTQSQWVCTSHKSTPKDDIIDGSVSFANTQVGGNTHQIGYFQFSRVAGNGDTFVDFAFSKGTAPPPASVDCPNLPARQVGDVVITFIFTNGGGVDVVDEAVWNGAGFTSVGTGNLGTNFVAAFNGTGTYGEGALDMTGSGLGNFSCHEFGTVYMDTHASGQSTQNEMKDFVLPELPPLCKTATVATQSTPNSSTVALGTAASDTATVTGVPTWGDPTGTVKFFLCGPAGTGLANTASSTTGCATGGTQVTSTTTGTSGVDSHGNPTVTYSSGTFSNTTLPGLYCWRAEYTAGNTTSYNNVSTHETSETTECFTVVKASPDIVTTPSATTALLGTPIHDTAVVGGNTAGYNPAAGTSPDGTVSFTLFGPFTSASQVSCAAGAPVAFTDANEAAKTTSGTASATYQSASYSGTIGDFWYAWQAIYNGNATNNAATSPCTSEEVHVTAPQSGLTKQERDVTTNGTFVDGPITASPGDTIEYQLVYTNHGSGTANNVVVTDVVPSTYSTYVLNSCNGCSWTAATHTLTWTFASVAPGASETMNFEILLNAVFPAGTTSIDNVGGVTSATETTSIPSNTVVANVTAAPVPGLHKQERDVTVGGSFTDGPITADPGDTLEYQLVYSNTGNAPASGVGVSDTIPAHTSFVSCTGGCVHTATTVAWSLGAVQPGAPVTMTFQVKLDATFPAGTTAVPNIASAGAVSSNTVIANVSAAAVASLHKQERDVTTNGAFSDGPITAKAGDTLEYQLVYGNSGNAPASNVTLTDAIPAHTTFVSCTGGCTSTATDVSWSLGTVQPGATATVTFQVKIDASLSAGSYAITNVAAAGTLNSNTVVANVTVAPAGGQQGAQIVLPHAGAPYAGGDGAGSLPLAALAVLGLCVTGLFGVGLVALRRRT